MSFAAACIRRCILRRPGGSSWQRFVATQTKNVTEIIPQNPPQLMMSSRSKPKSNFFFYDVTAGEITREVHLPSIADHHLIGSSQGFIFSVDREGEIHATSPFTGAHVSLPSSSFLPNITGVKKKKKKNTVISHYNIKGYDS